MNRAIDIHNYRENEDAVSEQLSKLSYIKIPDGLHATIMHRVRERRQIIIRRGYNGAISVVLFVLIGSIFLTVKYNIQNQDILSAVERFVLDTEGPLLVVGLPITPLAVAFLSGALLLLLLYYPWSK